MGRPRTIHVDRDALLAAILAAEEAELRAVEEGLRAVEAAHQAGELDGYGANLRQHRLNDRREAAAWVPYNLPTLAGRPLTASELVIHRKELRAMVDAQLIDLHPPRKPNHIALTPAGLARVDQLLAAGNDSEAPG